MNDAIKRKIKESRIMQYEIAAKSESANTPFAVGFVRS